MPLSQVNQPPPQKLRYITSDVARKIDEALMSEEGMFSIDQLMELAGLACAQTVYACYHPDDYPNVLVAAGPGNQGGDGLVAARHLTHFGYNVSVWYPKEGKTDLFAVSHAGRW
jgi:NAD(P)H-hydrate epimerase